MATTPGASATAHCVASGTRSNAGARLLREARALARLAHPNVVRVVALSGGYTRAQIGRAHV